MTSGKLVLYFVLSLIVLSCGDKTGNVASNESKKEALLNTIKKFNTAFKEGDIDVLESMITENYLHTNGNSKVIQKKDWFNYLTQRSQDIASGKIQVTDYTMDETAIEFHGSTAIVTGRISVSTLTDGQTQTSQYRITNIWVLEDGNWKRAGFHDGKIQ
ncbi:nuclear transport factor 2 family protein [Flagellimonas nanhaiensis]|nr:nuclear transport factor 2 family protein [Allomuricauda nanhaiensis]